MSEIDQGNSAVEEAQRIQDQKTIKEHLHRPGVMPVVNKTIEAFRKWPGREMLLGITSRGMVFGLKSNSGDSLDFDANQYKAFSLDTTLPSDRLQDGTIIVDLKSTDVTELLDGGTVTLASPPETIRNEHDRQVASFFEKTGGFYRPPKKLLLSERPIGPPTVGNLPLYPISDFIPQNKSK